MRKAMAAALLCLLCLSAQAVQTDEEAPPLAFTYRQLREAEARSYRDLDTMGYTKRGLVATLDGEGRETGRKEWAWRFTFAGEKVTVEKVGESESTLKDGLFVPEAGLRELNSSWPRLFTDTGAARYVGVQERGGRRLAAYRVWATEEATQYRPAFDGMVWLTLSGVLAEAEGRRAPSYQFFLENGERKEARHFRTHMLYRKDGLPESAEGADVLTFTTVMVKDKNGKRLVPKQVRAYHRVTFENYRRYRPEEPKVIEMGDIEPEQ